jgi:hypothetical protein
MNINIKKMKEDLKQIAKELKTLKPKFKEQQREISKKGISFEKYYRWDNDNKREKELIANCLKTNNDIVKAKKYFRHMHLAYCLLKGRKYEQIENKVRSGNEPDQKLIKKIQEAYCETT